MDSGEAAIYSSVLAARPACPVDKSPKLQAFEDISGDGQKPANEVRFPDLHI